MYRQKKRVSICKLIDTLFSYTLYLFRSHIQNPLCQIGSASICLKIIREGVLSYRYFVGQLPALRTARFDRAIRRRSEIRDRFSVLLTHAIFKH